MFLNKLNFSVPKRPIRQWYEQEGAEAEQQQQLPADVAEEAAGVAFTAGIDVVNRGVQLVPVPRDDGRPQQSEFVSILGHR